MRRNLIRKPDLILMLLVLFLAAAMGIFYYMTHRAPALRAEITVDGALVETLDLSKDQEITIQGTQGGTNHLIVQDGEIWCEEASCPDKVCVHQGRQSLDGSLIVCLPNRMIVKVVGEP